MFEIRGYSKLYDSTQRSYNLIQFLKEFITFLFFTDMLIYFIHRALHHRFLYKHFHKLHHRWIIPTPFASHAFQWLDGFLQSLPYHLYVFLFPLHNIHDGNYSVPKYLQSIINGAAHHNDHHQYYDCNYGQFITLWDRLMNTFHSP
ncbi:unnamed protein product, partial [Rotaria sp. Silwood1]